MLNRLLVTGAAGGVGKAIRPHLAKLARHVRLSDIETIGNAEQHEEIVACDLADAAPDGPLGDTIRTNVAARNRAVSGTPLDWRLVYD